MQLKAHWPSLLEAARRGNLEPARQGREQDSAGAPADYFYGRCLAEAEAELDEAVVLLRGAREAEPGNTLVTQTLALALARSGAAPAKAEAAAIWRQHGLPQDQDLLGQVSLTLEAQLRPWPEPSPIAESPWPAGLPKPEAEQSPQSPLAPTEDKMSPETATKSLGFFGRRRRARAVARMEEQLLNHQPLAALRQAGPLLEQGLEGAEMHLVAGLAAEETGDPQRARAHLARAADLNPSLLLARTYLGRIYWHCGWFELALVLWRSLPVEGPYDYGRHYHLALGHDALGDRCAALQAMRVALNQFYFDTRHFYIKRALWQWQERWNGALV